MKQILILLFSSNTYFAFGQGKKDSVYATASVGLKIDRKQQRKNQIKLFADSINTYLGGALPNFLFDVCIDWEKSYWEDLHSAVSVRWLILKQVNNKQALKIIINQKDKRTKLKCDHVADNVYPNLAVPLIKSLFMN